MFRNVASKLRAAIRSWLGITDPPVQLVEPPRGMLINPALLAQTTNISAAVRALVQAGEQVIQRRVEAPKLLPGVVPEGYAYDAANDPGALGPYVGFDNEFVAPIYAYANNAYCGLGFPGYAYLAELTQRSEYRAPSETISSEMTREFIKLVVKGKARRDNEIDDQAKLQEVGLGEDADVDDEPEGDGEDSALQDKLEQLTEAMEEFKVREVLAKCALLDGEFGRAQVYIDLDPKGMDPEKQKQLPLIVDERTIPQGSLRAFTVIEPMWSTPFTYNATDPTRQDFYKPIAWFVLGKRIHSSRLLTFIMREVPDILKAPYNFGGISMTQLMESYVFRWLRTSNSVSDLIHNFSVMALKTDMTAILAGAADKPGGLMDRAKLFVQTRDNQGLTLLDFAKEELEAINVPLAGLEGLQAQSQEQMAAPSHIPLVKLLGISPAGLNASSEGEIAVFYDFVRACQIKFFGEHLNTIIQILQLHLFGEIDDAIGYEFQPLSSPTTKELSEIRKADAETDGIYIDKGVVAPEEARQRVATDPHSGYDNLKGPPPTPPTMVEGEHGAGLEEEAAQAGHERSEESAEAAHKRSMQADKAAAKNKPKV